MISPQFRKVYFVNWYRLCTVKIIMYTSLVFDNIPFYIKGKSIKQIGKCTLIFKAILNWVNSFFMVSAGFQGRIFTAEKSPVWVVSSHSLVAHHCMCPGFYYHIYWWQQISEELWLWSSQLTQAIIQEVSVGCKLNQQVGYNGDFYNTQFNIE